jgi:superfamily II DNA or RNA helicase
MTNALHPKSAYWIRQGIFDDLQSFEAFEARVNRVTEEKDRGDIFEIFVEGYLATQTIAQCVKHWVVGNIPLSLRERYKLPNDPTGIDGIYEAHDGSHVAYQIKYRQKQSLSFAEVAPFLGITEQFSDRVVFTNASTLSDKAVIRTRWVNGEIFRTLSPDAFSEITAWLKVKPIPVIRATPNPNYQVQALADIKAALTAHDRAAVVMACGTGKTLVSLWAAEQEAPRTVLVLVPSLTLLQQTLLEWSQQTSWGSSFSYLCVCSDPTVNLKGDELNTDTSEVGFRIDTDPEIVRRFLERQTTDIKIIFSTYHSSPVVGDGARGLPPFDVGIFDEAHKTIGLAGSAFGYAISDENIRIKKRLFLTATPRHIDIRHRDKEGEFRIYSMDDEAIYGPRAHTLSFGAAAAKGIICRYKVVISLINKEMVDGFTRRLGITLIEHDEISAQWMANLIAIQRAIETVDAKKIISFHSRVRLAKEFAANEPRGIAYHLRDYDVRHVNGEQSSGERGDIIRSFADAPRALLTNARCLTEGINIPAVDMVAFIDPRQSKVDIAQAVGRAMRLPRSPTAKTFGYIAVPVFAGIGQTDSLEDAIKNEKFDAVVDVLNALQEHDEELVDIIREMRERKGAGETFNPRRLNEKVEVIGPRVDLDRLTTSIDVEIADRIGSSWDEWFGLLVRFKEREGHCQVPVSLVEDALKLGQWAAVQRKNKDIMPAERRRRLNEIDFVWDTYEYSWEEHYAVLTTFKARETHCSVPARHIEGSLKLGVWVRMQRSNMDVMSPKRRQRLDTIGFVWDHPLEAAWEEAFAALTKFTMREGHCRVPNNHVDGTSRLGYWVGHQRANCASISSERRQRLEAIGFVWDQLETAWDEAFVALTKFEARKGHCRVPKGHTEGTLRLGLWIRVQRRNQDIMSAERKALLDAVGFIWEPLESVWEEGFAALTQFKTREGHCQVPGGQVEGTFKLGQWVRVQRWEPDIMPAERKARLDAVGFIWNALELSWKKAYAALTRFKAREGHCRVSKGHVEGTCKLGQWVSAQRLNRNIMSIERRQRLDAIEFLRNRHSMPPDRRQRLDETGFIWDPLASAWEAGFAALNEFKVREGHSRVPVGHVEDAFSLGNWVHNQRKIRDQLPPERRQRLDEIGFVWRVK